jgi:hypothetical protein
MIIINEFISFFTLFFNFVTFDAILFLYFLIFLFFKAKKLIFQYNLMDSNFVYGHDAL